jgi:phenylpyruvate tautomerase
MNLIDNDRNSKLTKAVTAELVKELGVDEGRGYFIFTDVPAENIGYKSNTFANFMK